MLVDIKEVWTHKYLTFDSTDDNKELLKRYDDFFNGPIDKINKIDDDWLEYTKYIKTNFLGNNVPDENTYYTWIVCVTLDSVLRMGKKNYPQVYLEECKYKVKQVHTYQNL